MTPLAVKALSVIALCIVSGFVWWGLAVLALVLADWIAPIAFFLLIATLFGLAFRAILDAEAAR